MRRGFAADGQREILSGFELFGVINRYLRQDIGLIRELQQEIFTVFVENIQGCARDLRTFFLAAPAASDVGVNPRVAGADPRADDRFRLNGYIARLRACRCNPPAGRPRSWLR